LAGSAKHENFSGKWALVSLEEDSGGGSLLKNFFGKCRPPVRCSNFIQRCVFCPFQKGGSCKIVGWNRRACFAFSWVSPWRLGHGWLIILGKLVLLNKPGSVGCGSPGRNFPTPAGVVQNSAVAQKIGVGWVYCP